MSEWDAVLFWFRNVSANQHFAETNDVLKYVHFATLSKLLPLHFIQVTTMDIGGVHSGISRNWFPASMMLHSVWNMCSLQKLCNAYTEATVHYVLLNWHGWIVSRKLRNPPRYITCPNFTSEIWRPQNQSGLTKDEDSISYKKFLQW